MLVKHLPRDSALNRELHGEVSEWSVTDHLLAAAVDHLAAANWMFACVNSGEDDQPEPPTPVPRPEYPEAEADGKPPGAVRHAPDAVPDTGPGGQAPSPGQLARFFG
ncbi:hypothetical protein [Streptomyces malaysiense]|uniref:hypothetical protein n=1 Tax=Streptomyces malaysiense TaxID=1428626 RepID=UPI001F0AEBE7|nr:hypothetical protein [Streptomyces malaysiense]